LEGIELANDQLVADRFACDVAAIAAAAESGDAQAQLHMLRSSYESGDLAAVAKQRSRAFEQNNSDTILWTGLLTVLGYLAYEKDGPQRDVLKDAALQCLLVPAARGSATAQYTLGMLLYCSQFESGTKADLLDAARWIRKAAMQGFMDAQYELGEMFRHGVFCDHIYMRFARKYIKRASVQGHVEAVARMKELRSCVMCGADDAKLACSLCHRARYCDSWCSEKHWCEEGGVGAGVSEGAGTRHKDTCPRTHAR
jgi:TPR repeat protein